MASHPRVEAARAVLIAGVFAILVLPPLLSFEGCAHTAAPRGGPPDTIPPILLTVEPDSLSVLPGFDDDVRFEFDELISERDIQTAVIFYPFDPRPKVNKGGRDIRVRPRVGWTENWIYHIHVEPVVRDLFGNSIERPIDYVISTGEPLTDNNISGVIFDRITGRPLPAGRVDLVSLPDTLRYGTLADSIGAFNLSRLPAGEFLAIGYEDRNNDKKADRSDRSDTVRVTLGAIDTVAVEFSVFAHDTVGPELARVRSVDSLVIELVFSGFLDPDAPLSSAVVEMVLRQDSTPVPVDTILHVWQFRSWRSARLAELAAADTVGPDTLAADTLVADTAGAGLPADAQPPPQAPADVIPDDREPELLPAPRLMVVLVHPLAPGEYVVWAQAVVGLSGLEATSQAVYEHKEPEEGEDQGSG